MTTLYIIIFAIVLGAVACIWAAAMTKTIPGYRAAPETYDLYQRINQELITAAQSPKIIYLPPADWRTFKAHCDTNGMAYEFLHIPVQEGSGRAITFAY